ncbi:HNH endonuclease [Serratia marcescens]|uniref:HNH endonuclease n=2 Tax=Serratia marcescens TaxID=615 RepID=UPI0013DCBB75|nr:HNH endonuclease [Serratia marcescens]MBH2833439.1 HNH endonuclease [Serratia marcescens]MDU7468371.1 HNH endonuclease [Serratia marcescens]WAZ01076.1 HNH endonuclease [Serratia marcescens]HEJ7090335.1 HNH endonuclease [Serratia marcescens]
MFYPILTRRKEYERKMSGDFYRYSYYRQVIEEDCQKRCVYCDLLLKEHAFEGMHLDHFRPQSVFNELTNDPSNLVLACPKCNSLKTNHWPCPRAALDSPSHDNNVGFIDPFSEKMCDYLTVDKDGIIHSNKKPADYIIELLKLNRPSRVLLRKRRLQIDAALRIKVSLDKKIDALFYELAKDGCDKNKILAKYKNLKKINSIVADIIHQV